MPQRLRYLAAVTPDDKPGMIAAAFAAVQRINGHEPDDAEIRAELEAEGLDAGAAAIAHLRTLITRSTRRS